MDRRSFLRASASPLAAPLAVPSFAAVLDPLRLHAQESSKSDSLIITKVEPYVIRVGPPAAAGGRGGAGGEGGGRTYSCVRIETAEGIHGWGEGTTPPTTPAVITQIRESGKLLIGTSAWNIEGHWTQIYTTEFNTLGGTLFAAMSAIDIALWDIVGKNVPIALGESLQSHYNFREVLEKGACRVLQPDVARVGGLTAAKKIAGMAEVYYVNIAPHNPNGPICTAASLHLATSIANFLILEQGATNTSAYREIFPGGWKESLSEMWVPEVPGIGVDFSPAYVKEHAVTM